MDPAVTIRAVRDRGDVEALIALCSQAFPEEVRAQGVEPQKYRELKTEDMLRQPFLWPQCGVAVREGRIIGAVVLTVEDEPDASLSYWQVARRVGLLATLATWAYDQVLEQPLRAHECLVDFLAVAPEARGSGVGAGLMAWAERAAAALLARHAPRAVAAHGMLMSLWVAADNAPACRLYRRLGYAVVQRTDEGLRRRCCGCVAAALYERYLGHRVWWKMSRALALEGKAATALGLAAPPAVVEVAASAPRAEG